MRHANRPRRAGLDRSDAGMVTVELALGMASVVLVLALALATVGAGAQRASLCQAVRDGARQAAVGDAAPVAVARALGRQADVSSVVRGRWVTVSARTDLASIGPWRVGTAQCSATTLMDEGPP